VFIFGRAVAGLGSGGLIQGVFTIVAQTVPLRKRGLLGGIAGAVETLAGACGPVLGGVLTDKFSWRACFGINLPLGLLALIGVVLFYEEQPRSNQDLNLPLKAKIRKLDLISTVVFVPSMTCLMLALQWGGITYGWRDPRIISLFVIFTITVAVFGYLQTRKGGETLLPPRILKQRSILAGAWFAGLCNASMTVVEFYLVIYFQAIKGYTATKAGLFLMPQIVGLSISCLLGGLGTTLVGYYVPWMVVTTIIAPIAAGLLTRLPLDAKLISILAYEALLGFGVGIGIQAPQVAAQTVLSAKDIPIGIGIVTFAQIFGPTLWVPAAQAIFQTRLDSELSSTMSVNGTKVPSLNVTSIENMGLSDLRTHLGGDRLRRVLLGYDDAVAKTMYLPVVLTCLTLLGTLGMEWRSVKKKQQ
jgi:MFS family permease